MHKLYHNKNSDSQSTKIAEFIIKDGTGPWLQQIIESAYLNVWLHRPSCHLYRRV